MIADRQVVVVLGASPKAERFSNQAVRLLTEHDYFVIPVNRVAQASKVCQ